VTVLKTDGNRYVNLCVKIPSLICEWWFYLLN